MHDMHHDNNQAFYQSNEDTFLNFLFDLRYLLYAFLTYYYGYEEFCYLHFANL